MQERGGYLIVVARFIPGGRTAVTLAAGILEMPWRKFIPFDLAAGFIWGSYAALVGYFGGKAFEEEPWKGLVLALAIAFGIRRRGGGGAVVPAPAAARSALHRTNNGADLLAEAAALVAQPALRAGGRQLLREDQGPPWRW